MTKNRSGFTLVELLITLVIIGILITLSAFGMQEARKSARDKRRKTDLELIRQGLETYRTDCNQYPRQSSNRVPSPLTPRRGGSPSTPSCNRNDTYIAEVPADPQDPSRFYRYVRTSSTTYELCASLENGSGRERCGGSSYCGSGKTCNYKVTNP